MFALPWRRPGGRLNLPLASRCRHLNMTRCRQKTACPWGTRRNSKPQEQHRQRENKCLYAIRRVLREDTRCLQPNHNDDMRQKYQGKQTPSTQAMLGPAFMNPHERPGRLNLRAKSLAPQWNTHPPPFQRLAQPRRGLGTGTWPCGSRSLSLQVASAAIDPLAGLA